MSQEIRQVVYVSDATFGLSDDNIRSILDSSRRNNAADNVTGMLIYSGGVFIQVLEGAPRVVDKLLATITDDTRHKDVQVFSDRMVGSRTFAAWAMAFIESSPADLATRFGVDGTLNRTELLALLSDDDDQITRFLLGFARAVG
ncbi:MAG: BLUF domain-containing protein [Rhodospirillales bacterium]